MPRWLLLPLLLAAYPASAQVTPAAPPPPAAAAAPDAPATQDTVVQIAPVDERMTVPVSIAGAGPFAFIIDTGAQRSVISRQLAGSLGLAHGRNVRLTAMSGVSDVGTVIIPSLRVSALDGPRVEAPALDAAFLGASGMLGIDTLQGQAVSIDFDKQEMAVHAAVTRRHHENLLPDEVIVRARSMFGQLVVTDAYCDGQRVRVVLDTGSAVSMGNNALRRRFARRNKRVVPIRLVSVTGGITLADYSEIGRIKLGNLTIEHLPMAFADAAPFKQFGLENAPAILLGMDALKLFRRVQIDFANRELLLSLPRDATILTG